MGLDTVELVLRTEDKFSISLPDDQCAEIITVGDLYRAVLVKLDLTYIKSEQAESLPYRIIQADRPMFATWTAPDVWANLKAIIVDQLQIDPDEVRESARFQRDLRAD